MVNFTRSSWNSHIFEYQEYKIKEDEPLTEEMQYTSAEKFRKIRKTNRNPGLKASNIWGFSGWVKKRGSKLVSSIHEALAQRNDNWWFQSLSLKKSQNFGKEKERLRNKIKTKEMESFTSAWKFQEMIKMNKSLTKPGPGV